MIRAPQSSITTAAIAECEAKSKGVASGVVDRFLRSSLLMTIAIMCVASASVTRAADESVQLIISHWLPPSHPLQAAIEDWASDIKKNSNETIDSVIFPAELLGRAFAHYDMALNGDVSVALVSPGYHAESFPIIAAGDLPFVYDDAKAGTAAIDEWYRKYAARELRGVHYCLAFVQDPGTLHSRRKVVVPDDVRGLKVRQPNATIGEFIKRLGGENLKRSAAESRDLLDRGEADAIFFPWGSTILFGIDKVVHYDIDAKMYGSVLLWVMDQRKYDGLSSVQRAIIDNHCTSEWAVRFASAWADFEKRGRAAIREKRGDSFIELKPEQIQLWRRASKQLRKYWAEGVERTTGANSEMIWRDLENSLSEHHATCLQCVD
jgi:TRAP-type C4-dicarboxylate transport system substrate-binding protein